MSPVEVEEAAEGRFDGLQEVGMEKISGIIPSSPRVASVDLKEAAPVRPGTPSFGRPEGVSSLRQTQAPNAPSIAMDTARKGIAAMDEANGWRAKDLTRAAMVEGMNQKFFMKNRGSAQEIADVDAASTAPMYQMPVPSNPAGFREPIAFSESMRPAMDAFFETSIEAQAKGLEANPALSLVTGQGSGFDASASTGAEMPTAASANAVPAISPDLPDGPSPVKQPDGLFPRGSFIDYSA